jgi:MoxR-like ATPase
LVDGTVSAAPAAGRELAQRIRQELHKRVVGQEAMIDRPLVGLLTGGHVLLEGVPGLAKTLTVRSLADAMDATFERIQFTPDLLPADVVGTMISPSVVLLFSARSSPSTAS